MGRKRGFFAEMQRQSAMADRKRQRAQAAAFREQVRAAREAERAHTSAVRAGAVAAKADARAAAEAEREAKRLYIVAQESRVRAMNADLEMRIADVDSILETTLSVDDYVDLEKLRRVAEHPPFFSKFMEPAPTPLAIEAPPEPVFESPKAPRGISALFGKKRHAAAIAEASHRFEGAHRHWQETVASIPMRQLQQLTDYKTAEGERLEKLAEDRSKYDQMCGERQRATDAANKELDSLIQGLEAGEQQAVSDYIGIVFGNSVYPEDFPWSVDYEYDEGTGELRIDVEFPSPDELPTLRQFKYVKAKDEIAQASQTQKEQRDRYASMVHNVVLRTLHEVWESDRGGKVVSISLAGGVEHVDAATGHETFTPLIAIAVERNAFMAIDLARVTPAETLKHFKAVVSKNPHALAAIDTSQGVRGH